PRRRRWRRRLLRLSILILVLGLVLRQANGAAGAFLADVLRAVIGPTATARVEATFLDLSDRLTSVKYQVGLESVHSPWAVAPTPSASPAVTLRLAAPERNVIHPAPTIVPPSRPRRHAVVNAPMPLRPLHTVV